MKSIQFMLTIAAGKQLIAHGLVQNRIVSEALQNRTVIICTGTTNMYAARAILESLGEKGFVGKHFFRGVTSGQPVPADLPPMEGDVIIEKGCWIREKTLQEAVASLKTGDLILKGANAVDLKTGEAAVLIGNPEGGTLLGFIQATIGRRARMMLPAGVEKRVDGPIHALCSLCNDPEAAGVRLAQAPGRAYTEIDAIRDLTGAEATLISAGGICGCEGAAWFQCTGTDEQLEQLRVWVKKVKDTPPYQF